jgi:hypothetical protein
MLDRHKWDPTSSQQEEDVDEKTVRGPAYPIQSTWRSQILDQLFDEVPARELVRIFLGWIVELFKSVKLQSRDPVRTTIPATGTKTTDFSNPGVCYVINTDEQFTLSKELQ